MTTELVPLPHPPDDLEPAPPDRPTIDLLGLILTGLKPKSAAGYRKDLLDFARFVAAPSTEAAVSGLVRQDQGRANAVVLAYLAAMVERTLSAATIARRLAALQRAVKRARMVGLTTVHLEVEAPRAESFRDCAGPGVAGWRRMLERAETEAAAGTALAVRNRAMLLLLHDRALRRGELVALDLADVDWERPAVNVLGKGRTSPEPLTINDRCRAALAEWVAVRGDAPGPLFTRADPAAVAPTRLDGESCNRMVQAVARRAGLTRAVRAHGLRHQAITQALDDGWDVRDVKGFSRHSRIDTVLIYDDRRKDVGGEITRAIGRPRRRR